MRKRKVWREELCCKQILNLFLCLPARSAFRNSLHTAWWELKCGAIYVYVDLTYYNNCFNILTLNFIIFFQLSLLSLIFFIIIRFLCKIYMRLWVMYGGAKLAVLSCVKQFFLWIKLILNCNCIKGLWNFFKEFIFFNSENLTKKICAWS